jgi:predicted nucleic acid-binding protein
MAFKVFVDTNIFIDILLKREPFVEKSHQTVSDIVKKKFIPYISSSSVTDFYYICRKSGVEKEAFLVYLKDLPKAF